MKSSDSLSGFRVRPELKCITDKKYLAPDEEGASPCKHPPRHLSQNYQICDIPDQGGGNYKAAGFNYYTSHFMTMPYDQIYRAEAKENVKKLNSAHTRSKSNVKYVKSDLKKGSFSDKQAVTKKGSQNRILVKQNEYKPLSPFQLKIANPKPALPKPKAKENKEEPLQQWRKYMRELVVKAAYRS